MFPWLKGQARPRSSLYSLSDLLGWVVLLAPLCLPLMLFLFARRRPASGFQYAVAVMLTALTGYVSWGALLFVAMLLGVDRLFQ